MKKIINAPADFVDEMLEGLCVAHPEYYAQPAPRVITPARVALAKLESSRAAVRATFQSLPATLVRGYSMQQQSETCLRRPLQPKLKRP